METKIEKHLKTMLGYIGVRSEITVTAEGESYRVEINGDNLNFLIGYRGESLDALQFILSQMVFKETGNWMPITIDINGYKKQKLDKLDEMVKGIVDRVRFHQKEMKLPPLNSYERRHVHVFLEEYIDVTGESRGEGKDRRLYIKPADKK